MNATRFVWQELITDDLSASREFYAELLGWQICQADDAIGTYELISIDGRAIGAMHTCDGSGAPAHWLPFIQTSDVGNACAAAIANGGDVIRSPHPYRDLGFAALLADPDGALFMALDSAEGPWGTQTPLDTPNWYAIGGRDTRQTAAFYANVFGFEVSTSPWTDPADGHLVLRTGATVHAGVVRHGGALPSTWYHYFPVSDLDLIRSMATFLGGKTCTPVMTIPGFGKMAGIIDPTGANFFVLELVHGDAAKGPSVTTEQARGGEQSREFATAR